MKCVVVALVCLCSFSGVALPPVILKPVYTSSHLFWPQEKVIYRFGLEFQEKRSITFFEEVRQILVKGGCLYVALEGVAEISVHDADTLERLITLELPAPCVAMAFGANSLFVCFENPSNPNNGDVLHQYILPRLELWKSYNLNVNILFLYCSINQQQRDLLYYLDDDVIYLRKLSLDRVGPGCESNFLFIPSNLCSLWEHRGQVKGLTLLDNGRFSIFDARLSSQDLLMDIKASIDKKDKMLALIAPDLMEQPLKHKELIDLVIRLSTDLTKIDDHLRVMWDFYGKDVPDIAFQSWRYVDKGPLDSCARLVQEEILSYLDSIDMIAAILSMAPAARSSFLSSGEWKILRKRAIKMLIFYLWLGDIQKAHLLVEGLNDCGDVLIQNLLRQRSQSSSTSVATTSQH